MAPGPFRPWLDERLLADDAEVLVVDKPSGIEVHGGDPHLGSDVVSRLTEVLATQGRDQYLGVHQRLDVGTSGVLLFVRDRALNVGVARDFEAGKIEKHYVAAVEVAPGSPLARASELELEHQLAPDPKDKTRMRVVRSGGRPCRTTCRVRSRRGSRALLELLPHTGRTHQLRVQLAESGAAIAGDKVYGGTKAPRLLLHAETLVVPSLGRRFSAVRPPLFARFLEGDVDALGDAAEVERRLRDAACRRAPLLRRTDVLRWVNGSADELAGVVVDYYAGFVTLSVTLEEAVERRLELAKLLESLGAQGVYVKLRPRADLRRAELGELAPKTPLIGAAAPEPWIVNEGSLKIEVALGDGWSTGLFIDQRDNRRRVLETSHGLSVLNLFSYTGSFSAAAGRGGARRVTSVDVSGRSLARAARNLELNGVDPTLHSFVKQDVHRFLERAASRGERFDWIVLDPPSFSSSGGKGSSVFKLERDYAKLAALAIAVLAPQGRLLAVTNHRKTSRDALRRLLLAEARKLGREVAQAKELRSGLDCPDGPEGPDPSKAVLLTLR